MEAGHEHVLDLLINILQSENNHLRREAEQHLLSAYSHAPDQIVSSFLDILPRTQYEVPDSLTSSALNHLKKFIIVQLDKIMST